MNRSDSGPWVPPPIRGSQLNRPDSGPWIAPLSAGPPILADVVVVVFLLFSFFLSFLSFFFRFFFLFLFPRSSFPFFRFFPPFSFLTPLFRGAFSRRGAPLGAGPWARAHRTVIQKTFFRAMSDFDQRCVLKCVIEPGARGPWLLACDRKENTYIGSRPNSCSF